MINDAGTGALQRFREGSTSYVRDRSVRHVLVAPGTGSPGHGFRLIRRRVKHKKSAVTRCFDSFHTQGRCLRPGHHRQAHRDTSGSRTGEEGKDTLVRAPPVPGAGARGRKYLLSHLLRVAEGERSLRAEKRLRKKSRPPHHRTRPSPGGRPFAQGGLTSAWADSLIFAVFLIRRAAGPSETGTTVFRPSPPRGERPDLASVEQAHHHDAGARPEAKEARLDFRTRAPGFRRFMYRRPGELQEVGERTRLLRRGATRFSHRKPRCEASCGDDLIAESGRPLLRRAPRERGCRGRDDTLVGNRMLPRAGSRGRQGAVGAPDETRRCSRERGRPVFSR